MLRVWSRHPNISRKIRALGRSGLMLSFVSRYLDTAIKPLHLFFFILHTEDNRRQYTFHNHFRMAHCYLSRCNPPIRKTKRKNIFLKEEHFIVWISKLCPVDACKNTSKGVIYTSWKLWGNFLFERTAFWRLNQQLKPKRAA